VIAISFWNFGPGKRKCKYQRMYLEMLICRWDNPCCALQAHNQQYHHSSFRKDWETTRLVDYLMITYLWSVQSCILCLTRSPCRACVESLTDTDRHVLVFCLPWDCHAFESVRSGSFSFYTIIVSWGLADSTSTMVPPIMGTDRSISIHS